MKKLLKWWTDTSLVARILAGVVIGAVLGLALPGWTGIGILGTVFVSALKAMAPVLVAVLVMSSISKAGKGLGARFRTVILLYLGATFSAALVAVSASFVFPVTLDLKDAAQAAAPGSLSEVLTSLLTNMVCNPFMALSTANYIGILFFAPFGILGLVFTSVSEGGLDIFTTYGKLLLLLVGCMLMTWAVINPLIHFILLRTNPYPLLWQCLKESGINAFFTRSSAANIPVNMALCKKLNLDEEFYSVSIPLGATINMSGAAVTITVLSLAVAHTMGIQVSFGAALLLSLVATIGACGTSGVAGGSLLLVPMACSFFGISADIAMQAVAVGFIIGVVQDSVETALNSSSDVFFTATAEMMDRKK